MPEVVDIVRQFPDTTWADDGPTHAVEPVLEDGGVLSFPHLPFVLSEAELRFLDERWADGKAKNISVRWPAAELRGAAGSPEDLDELKAMIVRYAEQSEAFVLRLFPHYRGSLRRGNTSFRPAEVAGRVSSWRKDDTRLHVDAFPSNPMHGPTSCACSATSTRAASRASGASASRSPRMRGAISHRSRGRCRVQPG